MQSNILQYDIIFWQLSIIYIESLNIIIVMNNCGIPNLSDESVNFCKGVANLTAYKIYNI